MVTLRRVLGGLFASLGVTGCLLTTSLTGLSDGAARDAAMDVFAAEDAPSSDVAEPDGSGPADAGIGDVAAFDAGKDASPVCCGCITDPLTVATVTGGAWTLRGAASGKATFTEITPETRQVGGGIFYATAAPLTSFELTFEASITASEPDASPPADGLAFVALDTPDIPSACNLGSSMCVLGEATGFGVAIRTYRNANLGPPAPYLAAIGTERSFDSDAGGPDILDGGFEALLKTQAYEIVPSTGTPEPPAESWHTIDIVVSGGTMGVLFDGARAFSGVPVASVTGRWGFVAGTGGYVSRHAVRNVHMRNDAQTCE